MCIRDSNLGGWLIILFDQFLTLPGVLIHELAHALGAILTGAKVVHFTIIKHGDALGSVQVAFTNQFFAWINTEIRCGYSSYCSRWHTNISDMQENGWAS